MYIWTEGPNILNSQEEVVYIHGNIHGRMKVVYISTFGRNIHIFYSMNEVHTVKNVGEASYRSEMEKSLC